MKRILILFFIAIFAIVTSSRSIASEDKIQIAGSSTTEGLTVEMAKAFKKKTGIDVVVRGGGSGRGIDGVVRDTIDIGNSSRDIKGPEIEALKKEKIKVKRVKVGIDGIVVIINKKITGVTKLDISQVRDIFSGKITNWKQVGGPDKKIVVYTRDAKSGTGEFFNDTVLDKKAELTKARIETTGNADLAQKVSQDRQAIGYVGFGFAQQIADQVIFVQLSHKEKKINDFITPTEQTIRSMKYPISRYVYQFVRTQKLKGNIEKFINFMITNPDITIKSGFLPVDPKTAINDVW